ncbi:MAG: 23S rRNA (adenine(2030)-N(6))-methyltransferase RlmJ [Rhodospirillaceae bacterium]
MNYRHSYHAGNFADVVKHAVLVLILEHLGRKPAPFYVLDTHAGIGDYDLTAVSAQLTHECEGGILRLMAALDGGAGPPSLAGYIGAVDAANGGEGGLIRRYPGSPRLARMLLRPGDRLVLCEQHPEDALLLKRVFAGDSLVAVHQQDGYQALKSLLPPSERRGLVLIDPPYETEDEAERLVTGLRLAYRRWPTGLYALWYPIKERAWTWRLHEALVATGITRQLVIEMTIAPEDDWRRLNGCGMVLVNPPWQLDETLATLLPWLHGVLGTGGSRVEWLVR